jgi:hypothetical protein
MINLLTELGQIMAQAFIFCVIFWSGVYKILTIIYLN